MDDLGDLKSKKNVNLRLYKMEGYLYGFIFFMIFRYIISEDLV